jgi:Ca2+-binding RTX toxin-like protein
MSRSSNGQEYMINLAKYQFKSLLYLSFLSLTLFMGIINSPLKVFAADLTGTSRDDTLYGTMADDKITGKDGKDSLFGNGGKDKIDGDAADDFIQGDPGDDTLNGNDGNDMVLGGSGSDKIDGGSGDDYLESSYVVGSTSVSDGKPDTLTCGSGVDTAFINPSDGDTASADCEIVVSTP